MPYFLMTVRLPSELRDVAYRHQRSVYHLLFGALAEIKCPTLIIAGSNDEAVPIHHAKMLHGGIAGSQLAVIDSADHALIWAHPDELVLAVDKFLEVW